MCHRRATKLSCAAPAGQSVTCTLASNAANGDYYIVIPVRALTVTSASQCGVDHTNQATATFGAGNPGIVEGSPATNSVRVTCPVLGVTKTAVNPSVNLGANVEFDITITNSGTVPAIGIGVSDTLPTAPGLAWQTPPTETPSNPGTCNIAGNVLSCSGIELNAGASVTLVERYGHFGGLWTGGLVVLIIGHIVKGGKQVCQGIGEEMMRRLDKLAGALAKAGIDGATGAVVVSGGTSATAKVGASLLRMARRMGAVSLLGLANDQDLLEDRGRLPYGLGGSPLAAVAGRVEYAWFRRGAILAADWVVTQHEGQSAQCARMGLRHLLVPNIVAAPADAPPVTHQDHDAVWVGNVHREGRSRKGLAELVGLAERTRELSFAVAGHFSSEAADASLARLDALPHVTVYGALSHDETLALIARSRVVINTSAWEGLSNVMLEGWSLYRPTVSLNVDPNGTLSSGELGVWAGGELDRIEAKGVIALGSKKNEKADRKKVCQANHTVWFKERT